MTETVLVVAKAPAGGRSKTRLQPPLTAAQAAALHEALLLDTLAACQAEVADVRILFASAEDAPELARLAPEVPLVPQAGHGLADALRLGIVQHAGDGPVAIVSSDVPGLPRGSIRAAFAALSDGADVVLGPALDGGYWLVAMRTPHEAPFRDIPWSTPAALAVTRQRCEEVGLRVVELELWRDIDTLVDLAFLHRDAEQLDAPRTVELVRSLEGVVPEPPELELAASALVAGSPWRAVLHDRIRWNGGETEYGYLAVPRAVFVAAVTLDGDLLLVRQYRHPVRDWTLEVPAGSVADGESPLEAAQRELREETGGTASKWTYLTTFFSSSAHISLRSDAFLATDVELGAAEPEEGELVTLVRVPLAESIRRARAGGFTEGQTALTILLAAERLGRRDGV
jgi:rSAM/selenodomain-associated transferase 1